MTDTGSVSADRGPSLANPIPSHLVQLNQKFALSFEPYTFIGGTGELVFTASLGDGSPLPSWLSFDSAHRTLSGTPELAGQFNVRITATDSQGKERQ